MDNRIIKYLPELRVFPTQEDMAWQAAREIADLIKQKPRAVLGLATGGTPVPMYQALVKIAEAEQINFSQVTFFNLDEYVGLPADDPRSYHAYMQEHLYAPLREVLADALRPQDERIHIPNGLSADLAQECMNYEQLLENAGGIDLQILGVGTNCHIGFNEPNPSLSLNGATSVVELTTSTLSGNARYFGGDVDSVPNTAITMGVGTILKAQRIILLASGAAKKDALEKILYSPINPEAPGTALRQHRYNNVQLYVDSEARPRPCWVIKLGQKLAVFSP